MWSIFFPTEVLFLACVISDPFLNRKKQPLGEEPRPGPSQLPLLASSEDKNRFKNLLDILLPPAQALRWWNSAQNCYFAFASV